MPVLWTPGADANHKLVLRLTADDDACVPFAATETDEHQKPKAAKVRQFDFSELHKIQKIPLPKLHEGSADLSKLTPAQRATREKGFVYARVCMHEKCATTRMLRITDGLLPGEDDDDASGGGEAGDEAEAMRQLEEGTCVELSLHGVSVALIDSEPRELLQLNLREMLLSGHTCDGVAYSLQARVKELSVDNMMVGTDSPVLLGRTPSARDFALAATDSAGGGGGGGGVGASFDSARAGSNEAPFMYIDINKRSRNIFQSLSLHLSPWRLVIDLGLLKALSVVQHGDGIKQRHNDMSIGCSPHLLAVFEKHREQGIVVPAGVFEDDDAAAALSSVHVKSMRVAGPRTLLRRTHTNGSEKTPRESPLVFHVSVAIDQDGAEDPIRELLQVYDKLLPQVPRWAEPVLPVLSNLASITDATFTLFAYSADDEFASPGQLGWKAAGHYASATTRQLGKLLGHSDMFGNPLGLVNRIQDAGKQVGQHVEAGIKQGELTELGKGAAELTQGVVGGTAEFVGKLGRSALRLMAATGVVSQRTRQLVAQERPRTVLEGFKSSQKIVGSTISEATKDLRRNLRSRSRREKCDKTVRRIGLSFVRCVAAPPVAILGGASVLLSAVDQNTRMLTARRLNMRMRPPRLFEPELPQLRTLASCMVVSFQMVVETVSYLTGLGRGSLWFVVALHVGDGRHGGVEVREVAHTHELEWPYRRVWDEVIRIEPTSLTDVVVLSLYHRPKGRLASHSPAVLVGETRVPVREVQHAAKTAKRDKLRDHLLGAALHGNPVVVGGSEHGPPPRLARETTALYGDGMPSDDDDDDDDDEVDEMEPLQLPILRSTSIDNALAGSSSGAVGGRWGPLSSPRGCSASVDSGTPQVSSMPRRGSLIRTSSSGIGLMPGIKREESAAGLLASPGGRPTLQRGGASEVTKGRPRACLRPVGEAAAGCWFPPVDPFVPHLHAGISNPGSVTGDAMRLSMAQNMRAKQLSEIGRKQSNDSSQHGLLAHDVATLLGLARARLGAHLRLCTPHVHTRPCLFPRLAGRRWEIRSRRVRCTAWASCSASTSSRCQRWSCETSRPRSAPRWSSGCSVPCAAG